MLVFRARRRTWSDADTERGKGLEMKRDQFASGIDEFASTNSSYCLSRLVMELNWPTPAGIGR